MSVSMETSTVKSVIEHKNVLPIAASPWSKIVPKLQLAWDSTSLRSLMNCPRRYQYEIIQGWRQGGTDLEFGGFFASAVERFKKARVMLGMSKAEAQLLSVKWLTEATWPEGQDQPWGGVYEEQWRCTGTEKYKNSKGNAAKCPWSHKGMWFPAPAPEVCGECGSPTELCVHYIPKDKVKNRISLIRLLVWYTEEQPEDLQNSLRPLRLADGTAAVELSVKMPLPIQARTGESFLLAAHLDDLSALGGENFIADNKTTKKGLNQKFWQGYSPDVQMDTYDLLGSTLFQEMNIRGVVVDAAQVLVNGAKFDRHVLHRTDVQREEWLQELGWWLDQAERFAEADYWPMNRAHCWACPFNIVCSRDPPMREGVLKGEFEQRYWNPLEER